MITAEKETQKRMEIIEFISEQIKPFVECIVLGGSMGYGQNYSVAPWCDIDTVVVIERNNVQDLIKTPFFNQNSPTKVIEFFESGKIDFFWSSKLVAGIETDIFVYAKDSFEKFVLLEKGITGFIQSKPKDIQFGTGFNGEKFQFNREVKEFENGWLYTKPALAEGKYWGGVPRDDFFFMSHIFYDKEDFYFNLSKKVWKKIINQMIKEYGKEIDLEKINLLNTFYTYQTNKQGMPPELIEKIQTKTKEIFEELKK